VIYFFIRGETVKNIDLKSLIAGIIIGALGISAVFASSALKSAEFNDTRVFYNGTQIELNNLPMVSVYADDETAARNYMPLRTILESMGYGVSWNEDVLVFSKDYLDASPDWINYADLQIIMDCDVRAEKFFYDEQRHAVVAVWDAKYRWDIPTAVIGDSVYVEKASVDHMIDLSNGLSFDRYTPEYIAELNEERSRLVSLREIMDVLERQEGVIFDEQGMSNKMQLYAFELFFAGESIGVIERVYAEKADTWEYVEKDAVNAYFEKYGLPAIK